jgi:hypothetical protein
MDCVFSTLKGKNVNQNDTSSESEMQLSRGTIDSGGVCEVMVWKWVPDMGMSPAPKWL